MVLVDYKFNVCTSNLALKKQVVVMLVLYSIQNKVCVCMCVYASTHLCVVETISGVMC